MDLREAYSILEVPDVASFAEAQASYRMMIRVWHPDRFASSPDLKPHAEAKLKSLNAAFDIVRQHNERKSSTGVEESDSVVLFREHARYFGGDPYFRELSNIESFSGGRSCIVEVTDDAVAIITFIENELDEFFIYSGVDLTYCRLDRVLPTDPCKIRFGSQDPSQISDDRSACVRFQNEYQAKLFYKHVISIAPTRKSPPKQAQAPPVQNPYTDETSEAAYRKTGRNNTSEDSAQDAPPETRSERDSNDSPGPKQSQYANESADLTSSEKQTLTGLAAIFAIGVVILVMVWSTSESSSTPRNLETSPVVGSYRDELPIVNLTMENDGTTPSSAEVVASTENVAPQPDRVDEHTISEAQRFQNQESQRLKELGEAQRREEIEEKRRQDVAEAQRLKEIEEKRRQSLLHEFNNLLSDLHTNDLKSATSRLNALFKLSPTNDALILVRSWLVIYTHEKDAGGRNTSPLSSQSIVPFIAQAPLEGMAWLTYSVSLVFEHDTQTTAKNLSSRRLERSRTTPTGGFRRWNDRSAKQINFAFGAACRRNSPIPANFWCRGRWIEMREKDLNDSKTPAAASQDFTTAEERGLRRSGFTIESAKALKLSEFWRLIVADEQMRQLMSDAFEQEL